MRKVAVLKNNIAWSLLSLLMLFALASCEDEKEGAAFKIVKTEIEDSPVFVKGTVELSSADFDFTVSQDWCNVVKEGNLLTINADVNYDFLNRSAEIVITSGSTRYSIPVTQSGILFELTDDKAANLNFNLSALGTRDVRILSNVNYTMEIPEEYKEWITVTPIEGSDGDYKFNVAPSDKRRIGYVYFKYLDKTIDIKINQFDYLSYHELLGPATMCYTNSKEERVETQVEFVEKVQYEEFYIKGTFESGIERMIPIKYVEEKEGELRLYSNIIDSNFTDPDVDKRIVTLTSRIYGWQKQSEAIQKDFTILPTKSSGGKYIPTTEYYPAKFSVAERGSFYKFEHTSEGVPNTGFGPFIWHRTAWGIIIQGGDKNGGGTSYGDPYDTILHIEILKEMN